MGVKKLDYLFPFYKILANTFAIFMILLLQLKIL